MTTFTGDPVQVIDKTEKKKPIFARHLNNLTGDPTPNSPPYFDGSDINWPNGGTVYRYQWDRDHCYDKTTGELNEEGLRKALAGLKPGAVVSIDIERNGYNVTPVQEHHIDFVIACKRIRPDCFFGYYKTYGHNTNCVVYPEGSEKRDALAKKMEGLLELSRFDDFAAPQLYPSYAGPLPSSGQGSWLYKYHTDYGFKEWASFADWIIKECAKYKNVIYPYFCPYTLQNGADGNYGLGYLSYLCPWFAEGVDFIMNHPLTSGMFFFDIHSSGKPLWDEPTKHRIMEVIKKWQQ